MLNLVLLAQLFLLNLQLQLLSMLLECLQDVLLPLLLLECVHQGAGHPGLLLRRKSLGRGLLLEVQGIG